MNKEQEEMQFLGFFQLYEESYKIIRSSWKIFTKITLSTLILPIFFIFLAQIIFYIILFAVILKSEFLHILHTPSGTTTYQKLTTHLATRAGAYEAAFILIAIIVFLIIYIIFFTSAVVYTTASVITGRNITFRKAITTYSKVWKRLIVTSICGAAAGIVYIIAATLVIAIFCVIPFEIIVVISLLFILPLGALYINAVSNIANVVAILENNSFGVEAMMKSGKLIQGKIFTTMAIFLVKIVFVNLVLGVLVLVLKSENSRTSDADGWTLLRIFGYQLAVLFVMVMFHLFSLVIETIIYFVCKSCNNENVDKLALLSDAGVEMVGEEVPLKIKGGEFIV